MEEPRVKEILVTFSPHDIYNVDETRKSLENNNALLHSGI